MDGILLKCTERLRSHISSVNLASLSRISPVRLTELALPNIGFLELVSAPDFQSLYRPLYESQFSGLERERSELVVQRLDLEFKNQRVFLSPYRVVGIRDHNGEAIAGAQFSVLKFARHDGDDDEDEGGYVVPYLQYIYVRQQNRRQGLSEVLHTLILAVTCADAKSWCRPGQNASENVAAAVVPFTAFETDPPQAVLSKINPDGESGKAEVSQARAEVHTRTGALTLMLRRADGTILSPHVQPGLEVGDAPLTVVWMMRPSPAFESDGLFKDQAKLTRTAKSLFEAYYRSLRDEGFPEKNIALAERMVDARCSNSGQEEARFVLLPLSDITRDMYQSIDRPFQA